MSKVGLVLGGGGVTGAAYQIGSLPALEAATGWNPSSAEVVVGTSGGATVAALVRGYGLSVETVVGPSDHAGQFMERLESFLYRRNGWGGMGNWLRYGVPKVVTRPGVGLVLGIPAPYTAEGIAEWVATDLGDFESGWTHQPTVIVAYDIGDGRRVAFGTEGAPDVHFPEAVAASCAIPVVYQPYRIGDRLYVDGGITSGTSADLVLGSARPLDLMIVIAPMAADQKPLRRRFYEATFDRAGRAALAQELERVRLAWPDIDVLVLTPDAEVLAELRPNLLSVEASVPSFFATLRSLRRRLAAEEVWPVLRRHLQPPR